MTQIVLITGRKRSGKDTSADYCFSQFVEQFGAVKTKDGCLFNPWGDLIAKKYSFADPLKQFLINVFGLTYEQCYGEDSDKNSPTKIKWERLPLPEYEIINLFVKSKNIQDKSIIDNYLESKYLHKDIAESFMSARELMEVFGTSIIRHMWPTAWCEATLRQIQADKPKYAFICDCRFPDEIDLFLPYDPIVLRLLRNPFNAQTKAETALVNYNWDKIGSKLITIDNSNMDIDVKNKWVWNCVQELLV